jgi:hypothetical protein
VPEPEGASSAAADSVAGVAQLYLGNILYALERCAMSLDDEGKPLDAAFYRGIGRKLAEAHGQAKRTSP